MKKSVIILSFLFIASTIFAQSAKGLKGPAAKNYKPWKEKIVSPVKNDIAASQSIAPLKGPEAKNHKSWKHIDAEDRERLAASSTPLIKRTGPAAKNFKPWKATSVEKTEITSFATDEQNAQDDSASARNEAEKKE